MARKLIEVQTLHGYTIEELVQIVKFIKSYYMKSVIRAVIMRYRGIHTKDIAKFLSLSPKTVVRYINTWNKSQIELTTDFDSNMIGISVDGKPYSLNKQFWFNPSDMVS